jgi:hypothetical protein
MHFFILSAMKREQKLARNGFVLITNMMEVEYQNLDMNFPAVLANAVGQSIPMRLLKIIVLNPPSLIRFTVPLVKAVLSTKLLERLHVVVDLDELPKLLNCVQEMLPVDIGGTVELDTEAEVRELINSRKSV